MKLVFTCGGTAGHINPAIAVAKAFLQKDPACEILFIGSDGLEADLVPREGFRLEKLKVSGFQRKFTPKAIWENPCTAKDLMISLKKAKKILKDFRPDAVIGTGGYASFPALRQGAKLGIATFVHESNAVPGLTTRMVADSVRCIMVSFEACRENYHDPEKVVVTGTPCREEFLYLEKKTAREKLGLDDKPLIVSCWGSLGAREMNKKIADFMVREDAEGKFRHIHATGSYGWKWMPELVQKMGVSLQDHPLIDLREYLYDMPTAMAAADLMICRAGAATISEITVSGTPAIIVPSPNVTDNHQEKNARVLEKAGAAVVFREEECSGESLYAAAKELLQDPEKLSSMRKALAELSVVDATERICKTVLETLKAQS